MEKVSDAMEGRQKIWRCAVTDDAHDVLKVAVTLEGVADLVPWSSASEDAFGSTLYKKPYYRDKDTDWRVWHYIGGLHLQGNVTHGEKFDTAEWTTLVVDSPEQSAPRLNLCEDDASRPVGRVDVFLFKKGPWKKGLYY